MLDPDIRDKMVMAFTYGLGQEIHMEREDIATFVGVDRKTIYNWLSRGEWEYDAAMDRYTSGETDALVLGPFAELYRDCTAGEIAARMRYLGHLDSQSASGHTPATIHMLKIRWPKEYGDKMDHSVSFDIGSKVRELDAKAKALASQPVPEEAEE